MTGKQFEKEIIKAQPVLQSELDVTSKVELKKDILAKGILIEGYTFNEDVIFNGVDLNCGIKFKDCVFKKSLNFINCKAQGFDDKINSSSVHLELEHTKINSLIFSGINEIERGISITDESVVDIIEVMTLVCISGSFIVRDSTVNNRFDITRSNIVGGISISENSVINSMVRFQNNKVGTFSFIKATFNKFIHIWSGEVRDLTFNDGIFNDDITIEAVPISRQVTIFGTEFKKSITFKLFDKNGEDNLMGSLNKIYIKSGKFGEQFIVNGDKCEILDLTIKTSKQLEGDIYFNSCSIEQTKISGDNYNSNLVFNLCNFNKLDFNFFNNYSTVSINSAKGYGVDSSINIIDSNVGKTHLFSVFLDSFEGININNSVLIDIVLANIKWFPDEKLNFEPSVSQQIFAQKKEIYRQLKFALEKQGDRISSLRFKSLEMKAFKQESFSNMKWYKRVLSNDGSILWASQSNNFGSNWLKPIGLLILVSLFFHFCIVVGISDDLFFMPNWSFNSLETTCKVYWENINKLPQLMNPTHVLSRVFPDVDNIRFMVYGLDYLLKIFLAFFIFQTISAFRKYIK